MLMASEIANFSSEACGGDGTGGYNGLVDGDEGDDVTIDYDLFLNILGEEETPDPSQTCPSYSMVEGAPECGSVMGSGRHVELPIQTDAFQGLPVENLDLVTAEHGSPSEYSSETKECGGTHPCTYSTEIFPVEANLASSSGSSGYAGFSHMSEFTGLDHYADMVMVPSYGAFCNVSADMTQPLPIGDCMLDYARHEVADLQPAVFFSDHSNISESQLGGFETFVSEASSHFDSGFSTPARSDNLNNYGNSSVDAMSDHCILPSLVGKSFVPTSLPSPLRYELFEEGKHEGNSSYDYEDRDMAGNFEFLIPENNVLPDMRGKDHKAHLPNRVDQSLCMDGISTCLTLGPSGNSFSAVMPAASHLLSFINSEEDGKTQMITMSSDSLTWDHKERNTDIQNYIMCDGGGDDDDDDICILEDISQPGAITSLAGRLFKEASHAVMANDALRKMDNNVSRMTLTDERQILRAILLDMSQPKTESVPPDGCLEMELLRHQRIALSWMVQKETASWPCCGGILADDQGLGKTVSTIALILAERQPSGEISTDTGKVEAETFDVDEDENQSSSLMSKKDGSYPVKSEIDDQTDKVCPLKKGRPAAGTLIVCPTSLIRQWAEEFRSKVTPKANVKVLIYHGSSRTKDPYELAKYDVVITTYSIVSMEVPKLALHDKDNDNKKYLGPDSMHPSPKSKKRKYPPSSGKRSLEKGIGSSSHKPFPPALSRINWFRVVLDEAQSIKNHRTRAAQACWGLRAKRRWCLSGTPIQNAVDDLYSYFRFLRFEPYALYKTFCSKIKVPIKESPAKGYRKLQTVLKMIMLRRTKGMLLDGEPIIKLPPKFVQLKKVEFSTEERNFYSKLEADSRAQFQVYAATGTIQQNYVNILLMLLRLRQACDHPLLVQGHDYSAIWKASLESGKFLPREKLIYLLNCLGASLAICGICHDPPEDAVVSICGHVFCSQCICEHLSCENNQCPEVNCKVSLNVSAIFSEANLKCCLSDEQSEDSPVRDSGSSSSQAVKTEPWLRDQYFQSSKLKAALLLLSSLSQPQDDSIVNIDSVESNNNVGGSLISSGCNNDGSVPSCGSESDTQPESQSSSGPVVREKAIVFSQWTKMLDLLEVCLKESPIQYRRLDGTMSVAARDKAVRDFNTLPEVSVMIMSLKAASLGLNMVVACRVILLDLWWNPTTEDQAIDRAHRIGQTRPVTVFRLTVKDTVEDRILALQQKKREMVSSAFGEDELGSSQTRLTADDLNYLFG